MKTKKAMKIAKKPKRKLGDKVKTTEISVEPSLRDILRLGTTIKPTATVVQIPIGLNTRKILSTLTKQQLRTVCEVCEVNVSENKSKSIGLIILSGRLDCLQLLTKKISQ